MIHAERHRDRIAIDGPFKTDVLERLSKLPGASINQQKTRVTFPLGYRLAHNLRDAFGKKVTFGPALCDYLWEEHDKRGELKDIANGFYGYPKQLELAAPLTYDRLVGRYWQPRGVAWMMRARRGCLADTPGLGKTLQAIATLIESGLHGPVLVLAPSTSIMNVWVPELTQWAPYDAVYPITGARELQRQRVYYEDEIDLETGELVSVRKVERYKVPGPRSLAFEEFLTGCEREPDRRHWAICNYEMLRTEYGKGAVERSWPQLFMLDWTAVIADESQKFLITRTSKRAEQSLQRSGAGELTVRADGFKLALSGTPFRGKSQNYWGTLNWLYPGEYTSYWAWIKCYYRTLSDGMTTLVEELDNNKLDIYTEDLDATMLRRTDTEVAPDRPPRVYPGEPLEAGDPNSPHAVWIDMDGKQATAYAQMKKDALAALDSGMIIANGVLAEITRLRQFAASYGRLDKIWTKKRGGSDLILDDTFYPTMPSNKYEHLVQWLEERGISHPDYAYGTDKVVIASQFTKLLKLYAGALRASGIDCALIIGGQARENDRIIPRFQDADDPLRVVLLNTWTGGQSITLDIANDMWIGDDTRIDDDREQLERRIDRPAGKAQKTGAQFYHVRTRGTIEEAIAAANLGQRDLQDYLLDGRRGVEFARDLIAYSGVR